MKLGCIFLVKTVTKTKRIWKFYALCNKVYYFGTCKYYDTRFISHMYVKLIILCKPLLNVSHIQK
jgi:hypothetical protein